MHASTRPRKRVETASSPPVESPESGMLECNQGRYSMRAPRRISTFVLAASIGTVLACSDSAQPLGTGDLFINDTAGQDAASLPPPVSTDASSDADAYAPLLDT